MIFRQLLDYETCTFSYLIADSETREAVLVDSVVEQVDRDLRLIEELGLKLVYTIETHIHADHITGASKLKEITGCQSIVPENANAQCADRFIQHNEIIQLNNLNIKALRTLGHTDSHMAYLINNCCVLTGDSLFIRGCGRTDFQAGDAGAMYDDIYSNLFSLDDDVKVYPGHDYKGETVSTIEEEKKFNKRLVGRSREEFIELMNNLNLPNPKKIMEAVPANEICGRIKEN